MRANGSEYSGLSCSATNSIKGIGSTETILRQYTRASLGVDRASQRSVVKASANPASAVHPAILSQPKLVFDGIVFALLKQSSQGFACVDH